MSFAPLAALAIHDVKNRLAAMAARAEACDDRDTLRDALAAASDLTRVLACFKADAGLLRPDINDFSPADLVAELVADTRPLTRLDLQADTAAAPQSWFYDEALIRMVLANALHNALRFAHRRIHVAAREAGDWLEFRIADDGPGYPSDTLAEPVRPAPLSAAGVGIGLHLAHHVAALHENRGARGRIELANAPGAVFTLCLPR